MSIHYNEKGKFFTEVITKDPVLCRIQTQTHDITGHIHVRASDRLIDQLERERNFVAVTEAKVYNKDKSLAYETEFMIINIEHIIWIIPEDDILPEEETEEAND
jgi:hypothetical protein